MGPRTEVGERGGKAKLVAERRKREVDHVLESTVKGAWGGIRV